ncbi:MAG: DUF5723 family protein [Bacteroidota bacterium]|nr:DUF5723 family protein [Bacteroidota bacterium]
MKIRLLILLIIISINNIGKAQNNLTIYNMKSIPQSNQTNPAVIPDCKLYIGMPVLSSIYVGLSNSGFAYNDLVRRRSDDSLYIDMDNAISKMKSKNNYLSFDFSTELFSLGFKIKSNYLTFGENERVTANFNYPSDIVSFFWKGNKQFIGTTASFDGISVNASYYKEFYAGYAREINDKLTVGAKAKLLFGKLNLYTSKSSASIYTDPNDFAITGKTDIVYNTSLIKDDDNVSKFLISPGNNVGMAIDLGGTYKLNDKFTFGASIIDLGFINWKNNVCNYNLNTNYTFEGIEYNLLTNKTDVNQLVDTLGKIFKSTQTENSYKTMLPLKIFLSGTYTLMDKNIFGLLVRTEIVNSVIHPSITASYNRKLNKLFSFSGSYSIVNNSYLNLGGGFSLNLGANQLYLVTDNVLGVIIPQSEKTFNILFGMNLTFGRDNETKPKNVKSVELN